MSPAVVRAGRLGGLAIPDARSTRLLVDGTGALVLVRRGGPPQVLAPPGEVCRIVLVGPEHLRPGRFRPLAALGLVVLLRRDAPPLVLSVSELFAPSTVMTGPQVQAATGLEALAAQLGLALEAPTADEVRLARGVRQRDLTSVVDPALRARGHTAAAAAAFVLALLALPAEGRWWSVLPVLAVLTWPVVSFWRRRRRFADLVAHPPEPGPRQVVRPRPPSPTSRNLAEMQLQVGTEDVVLVAEGHEWWLPGPALPGPELPGPAAGRVRRCVVHPDAVVLADDGDRALLLLDPVVWGPAVADLEEALGAAGVDVRRVPEPWLGAVRAPAGLGPHARRWPLYMDDLLDGAVDPYLPPLLHVASWFVLALAVGAAGRHWPWGLLLAAWAVVLPVLCTWATLLQSRWRRSMRQWVREPVGASPAQGVGKGVGKGVGRGVR